MQHGVENSPLPLLGRLLAVVFDAIGMVVGLFRQLLESVGFDGPIETLILLLVGAVIVLTAFQLLGRLFIVLLVVFLLLLVLRHVLPPGAGHQAV